MNVNVVIQVTDGTDPAQAAALLNRKIQEYGTDSGVYLGETEGDAGHAVAGEIYVPPTGGIRVYLTGASAPEGTDVGGL